MGIEESSSSENANNSRRNVFIGIGVAAVVGAIAFGSLSRKPETPVVSNTVDKVVTVDNSVDVPANAATPPKAAAPKTNAVAPPAEKPADNVVKITGPTPTPIPKRFKPLKSARQVPVLVVPPPVAVPSNASLIIQAEVVALSPALKAGEYEGKSYLTYTKYKVLSVEKGTYDKPMLVAAHWAILDGKPGVAAAYKVGQKVKLELDLFDDYIAKNPSVSTLTSSDEVSDVDSIPYWGG